MSQQPENAGNGNPGQIELGYAHGRVRHGENRLDAAAIASWQERLDPGEDTDTASHRGHGDEGRRDQIGHRAGQRNLADRQPSRIGVTANWAATVTPRAAADPWGRIPENMPDPTRIPTVAATES